MKEMRVLGIMWDPKSDMLRNDLRANVHVKKKGLKTGPEINFDDVEACVPVFLSKRMVWRILLQDYDPVGLLSPITKGKHIMRLISIEKLDWEDTVSEQARTLLVAYLKERGGLVNSCFQWSLVPDGITGLPLMIVFSDGSSSAYCCVIYLRWPTVNGYYVSLVMAKVPLRCESIPHMEMLGALIGVRLAMVVEVAMPFGLSGRRFLTDSTFVLLQIKSETAQLNVFNQHHVSEAGRMVLVTWRGKCV